MRRIRLALIAVSILAWAQDARAATPVAGGNIINQVWDSAGSPYVVSGDVIVPLGAYLVIQEGTTIEMAAGDALGSGLDPARIEFTIHGTLDVNGTAAAPVVFQADVGTAAGTWYGLVIASDAAVATLDHVQVRHGVHGLTSNAAGSVLAVANATFDTCSNRGVYLTAGSPGLTGVTSSGNVSGIYVTGGSPTITGAILRSNSSYGLFTQAAGTQLVGSSVYGNSYGVYVSASGVQVRNSIVSNNSSYGVYLSSGSVSTTYSDVWGNTSNYAGGAGAGTGTISANPLYVSAGNLRITSRSPCRFGGDTGGDMGALPFSGDATPGLYGTLWVNTTLAASGSPYDADGDLTVAPGVTLTIDPGVTINFDAGDIMGAYDDPARGELRVLGTLDADGTTAAPITIRSTAAAGGSWQGVRFHSTASGSTLRHAVIPYAVHAIRYDATGSNTIEYVTVHTASNRGIYVTAGSPTLDAITAYGNVSGVYVTGSGPTITNSVLRGNSSYGLFTQGAGTTLQSSTVYGNSYGVYVSASSVTVRNSLVTNNSSYGVYLSSGSVSTTYSDVWGNTSNYAGGAGAGTGTLSANPQYVSPPGDLHVLSTSVAIDSGIATGAPDHDRDGVTRPLDGNGIGAAEHDMGAYEFVLTAVCGNGFVEPGESCDHGPNNGMYGYCNGTCSGLGPRCGDSIVNGPETCDDGNSSNTDACLNTCVTATCGDGYVRAGVEACDDGNASNGDACLNTCVTAACGDGHVYTGFEACDDGNTINTDACLNTCVAASCGDLFVWSGVEECDDGNSVDTDACLDCVAARCGDGVIRTGVEECDDGNLVDGDACLNSCASARCGDGVEWIGVEQCDDGNTVNTDACLNTCFDARCGDGYVQTGVEECDDGNAFNTDACLNTCVAASCGDGLVWAGMEECDDGNGSGADACVLCNDAACGDGFVYVGVEACDDGNTDAGDGCSPLCEVEPGFPDAGPPEPDAAAGAPDAGADAPDANPDAPDANPDAPDANPDAPDANPDAPDAGDPGAGSDGGCGCRASSRGGSTGGALLFLCALLFLRRRGR